MKASVPIILSFVVGTLVTVAFVRWSVDGQAAALPVPHVVPVATETSVARGRPTTTPPAAPAVKPPAPTLLNIPRLHLKAKIGTDLDVGPAWWPVTGRPGGGDTIAVAGHRTTHTRPFYWLDQLQTGDAIYVRWQGQVYPYTVSGRRILSANDLHIADARGHEVLLLSACNPRGSARQRIVVFARPRQHA